MPYTAADQPGLSDRVEAFAVAATLSERIDAFVALVRWTRQGPEAYARLDALLDRLDDPVERYRFQAASGAILAETDGASAFAHAGIPSERGFPAELGERVMNHLLPRPRNDHDLGHLIRLLFRNAADAERLALMPESRLGRLASALYPAEHPAGRHALKRSFADGFRLLATWVQAHGLAPKLRKRSRPCEAHRTRVQLGHQRVSRFHARHDAGHRTLPRPAARRPARHAQLGHPLGGQRALISAARAYELRGHDNSELLQGLLRRFRKTPLDFFVSPRAGGAKSEATARA